jgi:hypothetical protein
MKVLSRFWLIGMMTLGAAIGTCWAVTAQLNTSPNTQSGKGDSAVVQQNPFAQTRVQPNFEFNVQRQAGICPRTVDLWLFSVGFEGGSDHTVIADTKAIAYTPAKLVISERKQLEYEAPLRREYASCVGQASSSLLTPYKFQFRNGKVSFRMDVSQGDGYREILYRGVSAHRPYIHWRAVE